jgi:hypothetical protein
MKDSILKFLDDEILHAHADRSVERERSLATIKGYLLAAKSWRASCVRRSGTTYSDDDRGALQFDIDCIQAER